MTGIIRLRLTEDLSVTSCAVEQWDVLLVVVEPAYLDVDVPFVHMNLPALNYFLDCWYFDVCMDIIVNHILWGSSRLLKNEIL